MSARRHRHAAPRSPATASPARPARRGRRPAGGYATNSYVGGVRWRRAGQQPAPRGRGGHRRAERRRLLRRRRRGAGVLRVMSAARCACSRCRPTTAARAGDDAACRRRTRGELRPMNAVQKPPQRPCIARRSRRCSRASRAPPRDVPVTDLTQDSRAGRAGRRVPRLPRQQRRTASSTRPRRVERGARGRAVGARAGRSWLPVCPPRSWSTPVPRPGAARRRDRRPLLRRAVGASCAVAGITGTNGKTTWPSCWRRRSDAVGRTGAYLGTHRLRPPGQR